MESFSDRNIKKTYALPLGHAVKTFQYICVFIFMVVLEKSVIEIFVKFSVQRSRHVLQYLLNIILI